MKKFFKYSVIIIIVSTFFPGYNLFGSGNGGHLIHYLHLYNFSNNHLGILLNGKQVSKQQNAASSNVDNQKAKQTVNEKLDTIIKLGGKKVLCNITKISPKSVLYKLPGSHEDQEMQRKDIEKVIYSNGRKEIFNKPVMQMIGKDQWESVLITENENDVTGLYKKAVLKANAASGIRTADAAKASAITRLQKKAANIGALMVLVIHTEMLGGYGEVPGCEIDAIAYSDTPPTDTASVNKAIRQMIEKIQNTNKKKLK